MREMRARRRRSAVLWTGVLLIGAMAIPTGSASAATLKPRPTPAASPTDRVLEQVSPVDKAGNSIRHVWRVADGEDGGVLFSSMGPFADVQGSTTSTFYRARRSATGWQTVGLQPRPIDGALLSSSTFQTFEGTDAQLDTLVMRTQYPFVPEAVRPNALLRNNVYRVGPGGAVDWLSSAALAPNGGLEHAVAEAVSADGQSVLLLARTGTTGPARMYVRNGVRTVPVSVDTSGTEIATGAFGVGGSANRSMSDDGQTVAFGLTAGGSAALYVRRDALRPSATTVVANRSRLTGAPAGTTCLSGSFVGLSADGARMLLTCSTPLTDQAPASGPGLYEYDVATDALQYLSAAPASFSVAAATRSLDYVYLSSSPNSLWLIDDQGAREVVADAFSSGIRAPAISRNGERLAFINDRGLDGGYAGRQMYVYDATDGQDGSLTCVSCRAGESSGGEAFFGTGDISDPSLRDGAMSDSFTSDGRFYFMSTAALTPEAPEGPASVYEFHEGRVRLMVAGTATGDARFAGASPDGTDVFVLTPQSLLSQDDDAPVQDLYSFRRGGGFPPDPGCPECTPLAPPDLGGERPGIVLGSLLPVPPSRGAVPPPENAAPSTPKPKVVSRRGTGSTVRVRVRTTVAGELRISGSGVRQASRTAKRAGTYTVQVRLSTLGRRTVERRGRLRLNLRVRLTPERGDARSVRTKLTVKRTTKKGS
ncbi:MAG: hypothetical protein WC558_05245 [Patulibacter sp.]